MKCKLYDKTVNPDDKKDCFIDFETGKSEPEISDDKMCFWCRHGKIQYYG